MDWDNAFDQDLPEGTHQIERLDALEPVSDFECATEGCDAPVPPMTLRCARHDPEGLLAQLEDSHRRAQIRLVRGLEE